MGWSEADLQAHYDRLKQPPPAPRTAPDDGGTRVRVEGGVISFVLPVRPTTKKTSQNIAWIPNKGNVCTKCGRQNTKNDRRCPGCGGRMGFSKILPSDTYDVFFKEAMKYAPKIRAEAARQGMSLPMDGYLELTAIFYRERDQGDLCGFLQAICDVLQAPRENEYGKRTRDGMGIIPDDNVLKSFDGSRLSKDSASPRIDVTLRQIAPRPVAGHLFADQEEKW